MKKVIVLFIFIPFLCYAHSNYWNSGGETGFIHTSIVMQNWKIDGVEDRIVEGSMPLFINLPVRQNFNLQISHSPAISRYGDLELSGLSDTWVRGIYVLPNNKMMLSMGLGLPTGKTALTDEEAMLSS